jgi:hypothetical protein
LATAEEHSEVNVKKIPHQQKIREVKEKRQSKSLSFLTGAAERGEAKVTDSWTLQVLTAIHLEKRKRMADKIFDELVNLIPNQSLNFNEEKKLKRKSSKLFTKAKFWGYIILGSLTLSSTVTTGPSVSNHFRSNMMSDQQFHKFIQHYESQTGKNSIDQEEATQKIKLFQGRPKKTKNSKTSSKTKKLGIRKVSGKIVTNYTGVKNKNVKKKKSWCKRITLRNLPPRKDLSEFDPYLEKNNSFVKIKPQPSRYKIL